MSNPTYPDSPDWQQNYTIDFTQPIYQGGKIRYSIRQADLEEEIARLQTTTDQADIKLVLLAVSYTHLRANETDSYIV